MLRLNTMQRLAKCISDEEWTFFKKYRTTGIVYTCILIFTYESLIPIQNYEHLVSNHVLSLIGVSLVVLDATRICNNGASVPPTITKFDPFHEQRLDNIFLCAWAGIDEELLFRGILPLFFAPFIGITIGSIFFTIIWIYIHHRPKMFLSDLGFGLVMIACNSIYFAVIFHIINNLKVVFLHRLSKLDK